MLDPFMGSGTSAVVAKKLNRQFIGFEISENYYLKSLERLDDTLPVSYKKRQNEKQMSLMLEEQVKYAKLKH